MSKRAVILAGGQGARLRPYTVVLPKPLMPIGEHPILEVIVKQLVNHGFDHITMTINHQAEIIKAFFNDGSKWNVEIDYSLEDKPLGTMGPLNLIKDLPDNFLVMNGDILTDLDYAEFYDFHYSCKNVFTISSHIREQKVDYGVLEVNELGRLCGFQEKPVSRYEVSMGVYMVSRKVLEYIPLNESYGFDNLMLDLIMNGQPVTVKRYEGYWLDIGRPDDYVQAIDEFDKMKTGFLGE